MDEGVTEYYVKIKMDGEIDYLLKADQRIENKNFQPQNCGMIINYLDVQIITLITSNYPYWRQCEGPEIST
jgi:hypothetical protein